MQLTLGPALITTKGQASPEVLHAYAWARELCQQVGETSALPGAPGLSRPTPGRATDGPGAGAAPHLAQQVSATRRFSWKPTCPLDTLNYLGELAAAQAHLAQGIALYDPQQHRAHAFRYGRDPGWCADTMPA